MARTSACQSCKMIPLAEGSLDAGKHFMPVLNTQVRNVCKIQSSNDATWTVLEVFRVQLFMILTLFFDIEILHSSAIQYSINYIYPSLAFPFFLLFYFRGVSSDTLRSSSSFSLLIRSHFLIEHINTYRTHSLRVSIVQKLYKLHSRRSISTTYGLALFVF